jgi:hypothetical protein
MDLQKRKLHFIQNFLKYANNSILDKFEEIMNTERTKAFEKELKPMSLSQYEQRITNAIADAKNNRGKTATSLKKEIATWK